jgi:hypothetical protein
VVAVAGFHVDPQTWSGEHLFVPRGLPGTIVVHAQAVELARCDGLLGFVTTPTAAFRR